MTIPDKLPFTALAGIIAAAVQASGATSGFVAACAWSLVILAAPIEAVLGYTTTKHDWRPSLRRFTALSGIAIAVVVVGLF